jgi:hypothetical protein
VLEQRALNSTPSGGKFKSIACQCCTAAQALQCRATQKPDY